MRSRQDLARSNQSCRRMLCILVDSGFFVFQGEDPRSNLSNQILEKKLAVDRRGSWVGPSLVGFTGWVGPLVELDTPSIDNGVTKYEANTLLRGEGISILSLNGPIHTCDVWSNQFAKRRRDINTRLNDWCSLLGHRFLVFSNILKILFSYKFFSFSQLFFQLPNKFYNRKFQNTLNTTKNQNKNIFYSQTRSVRGGRKSERLREREQIEKERI